MRTELGGDGANCYLQGRMCWAKHRSCKHDNNVGRLYFYQHFYSIKSDSGYILLFIVYLSFSSLTLNVYESYLICSKVVSLSKVWHESNLGYCF